MAGEIRVLLSRSKRLGNLSVVIRGMGWMRFLLAAAVVFHHSTTPGNMPLVDGHQAVRLFYIISGFYMALILGQKYPLNRQGLWIFYTNRAARVFPVYWVVLIGAAVFYGECLDLDPANAGAI